MGTHPRSHDLGREQIDSPWHGNHGIHSRSISSAQNRARVSWIREPIQNKRESVAGMR
jgi:hypothetical protein